MKQRFSSLDVRAICHELNQTLAGSRLSNVYDLVPPSASSSSASTPRALLLRFSRGQDKQQLVVDSGFRCHLTAYDARTSASGAGAGGVANAPSAFVSRLRTLLNGRHVSAVAQVGTDRIVELRFSDGQLRLYLEFFAAGNVVLTDGDAKVLALQRTVAAFRSASLDVTLSVGSPYALGAKQNVAGVAPLTVERVRAVLLAGVGVPAGPAAATGEATTTTTTTTTTSKQQKKKKGLSRILALAFTDLPQVLIDHVLLVSGFETPETAGTTLPADVLADDARVDALFRALQDARVLAESLTTGGAACEGYIIATRKEKKSDEGEVAGAGAGAGAGGAEGGSDTGTAMPALELDYVDFHPFKPRQFELDAKYHIMAFDGFNKAADEFYSHLQGRKADRQQHQQQSAASKKLEATRRDQAMRIEGLQETQQLNERKAAAIEANQDWVQAAIDAVNTQLRLGTDWGDLAQIIQGSAGSNPVASIIKLPLRLAESTITLRLSEEGPAEFDDEGYYDDSDEDEDENEEEDEEDKAEDEEVLLDVDVNLSLSAWANARSYYEQKRVAAVKEKKTQEVTSLALRNAEKKVAEELKRVQQRGGRVAPARIRRQLWFEKFTWFVSSDGHLVLAAKEAQQSEMLYRRHLRRGDIYVHADSRGSPGIIVIKNRPGADPDAPVPPTTLAQAGTLAICASEAWETKAGLGAYWMRADQVHKTTPSGEVLPLGVFDVRGDKNHLAPPQRVLGFGLLFRISDGSQANHRGGEGEAEVEVEAEAEAEVEGVPEGENGPGDGDEKQEAAPREEQPSQPADTADTAGAADTAGTTDAPDVSEGPPLSSEPSTQAEPQPQPQPRGKPAAVRAVSPAPSRASTAKTAAPTSKRGQKSKAKKLAKYKDQDEEDRARAEIVIGVAAGREKAEAKARAKAQREAELAAYEERRRAQRERQEQATREFEAARQAKLLRNHDGKGGNGDDNDDDDDDDDDDADLGVLASLVGRPAPGDEILEAVPVCAPWTALARLKYKVKIQPGQTKKGRAMRDVLERWRRAGETPRAGSGHGNGHGSGHGSNSNSAVDDQSQDPERMWPREVELIRGLKMEEAANCVPVSKMTLMVAGGMAGGGGGGGGKGGGGKAAGGKGGKQSGPASGKKAGGKGGKKK